MLLTLIIICNLYLSCTYYNTLALIHTFYSTLSSPTTTHKCYALVPCIHYPQTICCNFYSPNINIKNLLLAWNPTFALVKKENQKHTVHINPNQTLTIKPKQCRICLPLLIATAGITIHQWHRPHSTVQWQTTVTHPHKTVAQQQQQQANLVVAVVVQVVTKAQITVQQLALRIHL